jgi:hypothetical protein
MYKVSFALKKNSKTKLGLISIRTFLPSGIFQSSTGIFVPVDQWSSKTQSLKRNSALVNAILSPLVDLCFTYMYLAVVDINAPSNRLKMAFGGAFAFLG